MSNDDWVARNVNPEGVVPILWVPHETQQFSSFTQRVGQYQQRVRFRQASELKVERKIRF